MKSIKPVNNEDKIKLPFSASKKKIGEEKIKQHWQRIKERIDAGSSENQGDNVMGTTV